MLVINLFKRFISLTRYWPSNRSVSTDKWYNSYWSPNDIVIDLVPSSSCCVCCYRLGAAKLFLQFNWQSARRPLQHVSLIWSFFVQVGSLWKTLTYRHSFGCTYTNYMRNIFDSCGSYVGRLWYILVETRFSTWPMIRLVFFQSDKLFSQPIHTKQFFGQPFRLIFFIPIVKPMRVI